ncbi:eso1 [Candida pseudojiufengensis]|uniref:eso1 n=1 Tax=Candida pseudojiufengensis TaxID=497109 RepID=UPI0022259B2E|nr:eso1 [Candida pseudojiufengensis]KAI5964773.1 eso1 [Candida pseudojiufengensis]
MSVKAPRPIDRPQITTTPLPKSQFTFKNLLDINNPQLSYLSPLSVISLVDLNAFYAQVETVRLGLTDKDPVVCQQWQSLIAVSYAARKYGISRLDTVHSALAKCPDLICAHAGVYKKGDSHWAYVEGWPSPVDHKVSLDTYRRESRKILRIIQQYFDLVDKASVDESYIDLGRSIYEILMDKFPQLNVKLSKEEQDQPLPNIPKILPIDLQWEGYIYESQAEMPNTEDPNDINKKPLPPAIQDWDDITLLIGSQLLFKLRQTIYENLGYTTSAGLARNKLVAKLSGGFKKPDDQTIIRNCAINRFLSNFELNDITGLGGKLGESLVKRFDVPPDQNSIAYIRENYDLKATKAQLKDDLELANKLYNIVRGLHPSELSYKVEVKSMTSTKNFRDNSPWTLEDAYGWLIVYAGDLTNRIMDLDNESMELSQTKFSTRDKGILKRPKTVTIGIRSMAFVRQTRQMPLPFHKDLNKMRQSIQDCAYQLIREYMENNTNLLKLNPNYKSVRDLYNDHPKNCRIMKMQNMSLTVSNFVALNDNSLIETFTKSNNKDDNDELIKINNQMKNKRKMENDSIVVPPKKTLTDKDKQAITNLFKEYEKGNTKTNNKPNNINKSNGHQSNGQQSKITSHPSTSASTSSKIKHSLKKSSPSSAIDIFKTLSKPKTIDLLDELKRTNKCPKCNYITINDPIEHNDYHIAIDLSSKWNN